MHTTLKAGRGGDGKMRHMAMKFEGKSSKRVGDEEVKQVIQEERRIS